MNASNQEIELPLRTPGVGCPHWCDSKLCTNEAVRDGSLWHHGTPHVVDGYLSDEPTALRVQATWIDKPAVHRGNDLPDFEEPLVSVEQAQLDLTPAQARRFAAALVAVADSLEARPDQAT